MEKLKGIVFPVARIAVWVVIAIALVKISFFSSSGKQGDELAAQADFSQAHYVVARGDISNVVEVAATVVADPTQSVVSPVEGYVGQWLVSEGDWVSAGTAIVELRREVPASVDSNGNPVAASFTRHTVTAPVGGQIHQSLITNQPAPIGTTVFTVNPGTLSISADLSPEQLYRLTTTPSDAEVTIDSGPAPFTCSGISVGSPTTAQPSTPSDPNTGETPTTTVKATCPVPADVRVFAGMTGSMNLAVGEVTDVLTVPITAVQGSYDTGRVWIVGADGTTEERDVTLGMSDGVNIEITGGLEEGETILQVAPGNLPPLPETGEDPMMMGGIGG